MFLLFLLVVAAIIVATVAALMFGIRVAGWVLVVGGIALLGDAAITIYRIYAHNGLTDSGSFYGLFAIIPAGALLLIVGGLMLCIRNCAARRAKADLSEGKQASL
jgi:TRAP-type mannitol/chloroaromatic compound transport system permease small subunit